MSKGGEHPAQPLTMSALRGCSRAWQDTVHLSRTLSVCPGHRPSVQDTPCHGSHHAGDSARGGHQLLQGSLCARSPMVLSQPRPCRGEAEGAREGQEVSGLILSNDVLDAGVQEHVLVQSWGHEAAASGQLEGHTIDVHSSLSFHLV